jgi:hypothetical protein
VKQEELRLVGNGVSELLHQIIFRFKPFQGSVTRSQAWKHLQDTGRVGQNMLIEGHSTCIERSSRQSSQRWTKKLGLKSSTCIQTSLVRSRDSLYKETKDILVVDTSQRNDFHADVSVATYDDARLPYSVRYFLEFKLPSVEPRMPRIADRCWIISKAYARSNHIGRALSGSYQTIPLPGSTTPCLMRKARKLRSILAHPLQTPSSSPKHRLPHSCERQFPRSIKH